MISSFLGGFRRVLSAPGWVLAIAAANLLLAWCLGATTRAAFDSVTGRWSVVEGEIVYGLMEILPEQSGLLLVIRQSLAGTTVLGFLFWTLLAGGVLYRLKEEAPISRVLSRAVRSVPTVAVISFWHLLLRLILVAAAVGIGVGLDKLGAAAWIAPLLGGLIFLFSTCALDLARAHGVLHGARRFHPATALGGFAEALRRPGVLIASMLLGLRRWCAVLAILWLSIDGLSAGHGPWPARGLWVVALLCGLARMGVAVEAGPPRRR